MVWPDTFVDESNLKVHISALRRALGDGKTGRRYISTVAGRGYCFVAPVKVSADAAPELTEAVEPQRRHNLPALLTPLIGRDVSLGKIEAQLRCRRLLTLVGPGGVGKTSVALAAAANLTDAYVNGVWFVNLTAVSDPLLVPKAAASAVGLDIADDGANSGLLSSLGDKQLLLVLDNCEHVIDAVAALVFRLLRAAPDVHILATSREPLRVSGEYVYRLPPLEQPLFSTCLDAQEALAFPAVRLFGCSPSARLVPPASLSCKTAMCRSSSTFAESSTVFRSRSNLPRSKSPPWASAAWPRAYENPCSRQYADASPTRDIARYAPRSTGATACSPTASRRHCVGSRFLPAASRFKPPGCWLPT